MNWQTFALVALLVGAAGMAWYGIKFGVAVVRAWPDVLNERLTAPVWASYARFMVSYGVAMGACVIGSVTA
jgi:hypothetical protein